MIVRRAGMHTGQVGVGALEIDSAGGQPVKIRCLQDLVAVDAKRIVALLVRRDQEDVRAHMILIRFESAAFNYLN